MCRTGVLLPLSYTGWGWRRRWDSNPRQALRPVRRFQRWSVTAGSSKCVDAYPWRESNLHVTRLRKPPLCPLSYRAKYPEQESNLQQSGFEPAASTTRAWVSNGATRAGGESRTRGYRITKPVHHRWLAGTSAPDASRTHMSAF